MQFIGYTQRQLPRVWSLVVSQSLDHLALAGRDYTETLSGRRNSDTIVRVQEWRMDATETA